MQVNDRRYLFCPARMTVGHLKRFLRCKLDLPPSIEVCQALCLEIVYVQMKPPPHHNRFTALFRNHPGEPVPEENFWTLWCKRRLTEADIDETKRC